MKAMILAAGKGTRLYPLTSALPKPMLPIAGEPVLHHILRWLRRYGIQQVAINLHHHADAIRQDLGTGKCFGVQIRYSEEKHPLGTAGGVKRIADFFDDSLLVIYGDVLTDLDLGVLVAFHRAQGDGLSHATLTLDRRPDAAQCGMVELRTDDRIVRFAEKPNTTEIRSPWVNSGIMVLDRALLDLLPSDQPYDFGREAFPAWLTRGIPLFGWRLPDSAYLIDMGTPEKYAQANRDWPERLQRISGGKN
ncbi:MAG: NDP-sugar synthase [Verrucomicrobia bacterium]|nr:MAG: NDP-sugar synthase [Verrucomicrobiota bacterium]